MRINDDNLQLRYYTDVAAAAGYGAINSKLEYTEIVISKICLRGIGIAAFNKA